MSYQAKWLLTLITMVIAMTLVIACISQGMFHFEKGSVKANDKEEPMVTQEVQDDSDEDEEYDEDEENAAEDEIDGEDEDAGMSMTM